MALGVVLAAGASLPATAQPLPALYQSAATIDPALAGAEALVRAAEERVIQAKAAFGPTVGVNGNRTGTRYYEAPTFQMRPFNATQVALQVSQPLLRLALPQQLAQAEAQLAQAQAQLRQAQTESMQRLVESCFDVLKARDALALLDAQSSATGEQLSAAQRSFKIGTAPITDVREAEAKADSVAAERDAAAYELDLRQQMLAEVVGHRVDGLMERGLDGQRLPPLAATSVLEWIASGLAENPQLRQAIEAQAAAQAEIDKAFSGHAPTVDLTFNYQLSKETGSTTSVFPRRADSTAVGVNVNIPLFASGGTHAKVREAVAQSDKAQSDVDAARRSVTLGVRQGFSATLSSASQARGLEAAVKSAETSLRANRRGYEVGMRINAEVLDAQTRVYESRRDLSRARYDAWVQFVKLKAVAGRLAPNDLDELDGLLVAQPVSALLQPSVPGRSKGEAR